MTDPSPVLASVKALPWYRESAFRAWIKKTCAAFGAVIVAIASKALPEGVVWTEALVAAGLYSLGDFVLSIPDIWFSGPDTFQKA